MVAELIERLIRISNFQNSTRHRDDTSCSIESLKTLFEHGVNPGTSHNDDFPRKESNL
jgi:hypothetical protein